MSRIPRLCKIMVQLRLTDII